MSDNMKSAPQGNEEIGEACFPNPGLEHSENETDKSGKEPCMMRHKVSDLVSMFQGLEKGKHEVVDDFVTEENRLNIEDGTVTEQCHKEHYPNLILIDGTEEEDGKNEDLEPIFDSPDDQVLEEFSSYSSFSEYEYSTPSDPFSENLDSKRETYREYLFSDNRGVAEDSPFEPAATKDAESLQKDLESDLANNNTNQTSISSKTPPPLPPRTSSCNFPTTRTNVRSDSYHTATSTYSPKATSIKPESIVAATEKGHRGTPNVNKTTKVNNTKLHDVKILIPEVLDFNRSVPNLKTIPNPTFVTGNGTLDIDACGDYLCSIGSSVRIYHIPTNDLIINFGICSRQVNTSENSEFLNTAGQSVQAEYNPAPQFTTSVTTTQSLSKSFLNINRSKALKNAKCVYIYGVFIPNNDLKNLRLITGNCISASSFNKSSSSTQLKKEKPTALSFLRLKDIEYSGRYVLIGTDKGSIICVNLETVSFGQLRSDEFHPRRLSKIVIAEDKACFLDVSGIMFVWKITNYVFNPIHKFKLPFTENYLRNGSLKHISTYASAKQLYVAFGKHVFQIDLDNLTSTEFISNTCRELGPITSISSHNNEYIITGHGDGKISVWNAVTLSLYRVIALGSYSIGATLGVRENMVWVGMRTGRIYVYNIVCTDNDCVWRLVNSFHAYKSSPVTQLIGNRKLLLTNGVFQILTLSDCGVVRFWDGFLMDCFLHSLLTSREDRYCTYKQLKVLICSWNVDAVRPKDIMTSDKVFFNMWFGSTEDPDIIAVCIQEIVDLESTKINARELLSKNSRKSNSQPTGKLSDTIHLWKKTLHDAICSDNDSLKLVEVVEMVGLFLAVFTKKKHIKDIKSVAFAQVKTGFKGYHGNKGAVALRLRIHDTSICFVNCHLAAHQNQVSSRNKDIHSIMKHTRFPKDSEKNLIYANGSDGTLITDHEIIFWSGDLNYRINMGREHVLQLIESRDWQNLLRSEQLTLQKNTLPGFGLSSFSEGNLNFSPTFKYDIGSNNYDTSEKKRVPSWCDRILYHGKKVKQHMYRRFEIQTSDHRPIAASFTITPKKVNTNLLLKEIEESNNIMSNHLSHKVNNEKIAWIRDEFMLPRTTCEECLHKSGGDILLATKNIMQKVQTPSCKPGN